MSDNHQKALDGAKAEISRLASELAGVRNALAQQQRALSAERVARKAADALIETVREHMVGDVSRSAVKVALAQYDAGLRELFPPAAEPVVDAQARTAIGLARQKRIEEE